MEGVILCAHGSRSNKAIDEFVRVAERLRRRLTGQKFAYGFLEFATPRIEDGLNQLVARGCSKIKALPGMLFAAGHVKNDVPSVLRQYGEKHRIDIRFGRELGIDYRLLQASTAQIKRVLGDCDRHQTMLVVVGRGSSDPDANSNISKVTRMLWEGLGLGWAEVAYSGVTFPSVSAVLQKAAKMGFANVVVFPYFLFTGILIDRVYRQTDEAQKKYPKLNFIKADYIGLTPQVEEVFLARLAEIEEGNGNMNCQLCKYRSRLPGFEDEQGLAQRAHHTHVEGIGVGNPTAADHHSADHQADQANGGDHHHPYPHADHPLGPAKTKLD